MITEQELRQTKRRRGNMLKFIRQGHEKQLDRMDDLMMQAMMQDIGSNMSQRQVMTMLQDLQVLGYVTFRQSFSEELERYAAEEIMLTAAGLAIVTRRRDNDEVMFS
jgi:hypothetical protein